jgi:hypothetical protein
MMVLAAIEIPYPAILFWLHPDFMAKRLDALVKLQLLRGRYFFPRTGF